VNARLAATLAVLVASAANAPAYIHYPPLTLPKMCKDSRVVRVMKVEKVDKENGVVVFKLTETLKGDPAPINAFRHVFRPDDVGAKAILEWMAANKTVVMFSIESNTIGCAYVFLDKNCYSLDWNKAGNFWAFIRAEPGLSICYHGEAAKLRDAAKDVLAGKTVDVPTKDPKEKPVSDERNKEVNDVLVRNRGRDKK